MDPKKLDFDEKKIHDIIEKQNNYNLSLLMQMNDSLINVNPTDILTKNIVLRNKFNFR